MDQSSDQGYALLRSERSLQEDFHSASCSPSFSQKFWMDQLELKPKHESTLQIKLT